MNRTIVLALALLAGCTQEQQIVAVQTDPVISILVPTEFAVWSVNQPIAISAALNDPETPTGELVVNFSSSADGPLDGLWTLTDEGAGGLFVGNTLSEGTHVLVAQVTDPTGRSGEDTVQIEVRNVIPPTASLFTSDDERYSGVPVGLILDVNDADTTDFSEVQLSWAGAAYDQTADYAWPTGADLSSAGGVAFEIPALDAGSYDLEVTITDGDGLAATVSTWFEVNAADNDGDGHNSVEAGGTDCDDDNEMVFVGADEYCDGIDNDCDSQIDENDAVDVIPFYRDLDGDSFGSTVTVSACEAPLDYVATSGDCDDNESDIHPTATELVGDGVDQNCDTEELCWHDDDDDCFLDASDDTVVSADLACDGPFEGAAGALETDCDDADAQDHPGATEIVGNGDDEDCDNTEKCFLDADDDGYLVGSPSSVTSLDIACDGPNEGQVGAPTSDCDDSNAVIHPTATEVVGDEVDQDCDGGELCFDDDDDDGFLDTSLDTIVSADVTCDSVREGSLSTPSTDCDDFNPAQDVPTPWYEDADGDSFGNPDVLVVLCDAPADYVAIEYDCDDTSAAVSPAADEQCDAIDNDCDGTIDVNAIDETLFWIDYDGDGYGVDEVSACTAPADGVLLSDDCDDSNDQVYPSAPLASGQVGNGIDNDCDGHEECYTDADNDDFGTAVVFNTDDLNCAGANEATVATDCDDTSNQDYPGAPFSPVDVNNGDDDDCDGHEECFVDADLDDFGSTTIFNSNDNDCTDAGEQVVSTDCLDSDDQVYPGGDEQCNGLDDNCNGDYDEGAVDRDTYFADDDGDNFGDPTTDTLACVQPPGFVVDNTDCDDADSGDHPGATETVGNSDDEDCNGGEVCYDDDDNDTYLDNLADTRVSVDADCADANEGTNADLTTDCNDAVASVYPGAAEVVGDEVDQDCDGKESCYNDDDDDNYLDATSDTVASLDVDCDDAFESDFAAPTTDCNDAVANVHPGATEIVADGIDQDCNSQETCYDDDDNDGFLDNSADTRVSADADCADTNEGTASDLTTDCNDAVASVYPGAAEITGNGVDENCDNSENCFDDDDDDGYLDSSGDVRVSSDADCSDSKEGTSGDPTTDCDDLVAAVHPNADETCNDVDDDCDTFVDDADPDDVPVDATPWYADVDDDGYGDPNEEFLACDSPLYHVVDHTDCDDEDDQSHPGLVEDCGATGYGDQADNDCNGIVDDGCLQIFPPCDQDGNGVADDANLNGDPDDANVYGDYTLTSERIWVFDCNATFFAAAQGTQDTLTIEPGTEMRFATSKRMNVGSGSALMRLEAVGTADAPILFTGKTPTTVWYQLGLNDLTSGAHTLEYVDILNANLGIQSAGVYEIWMDNVHMWSTASGVRQNGLRANGDAVIHIENSTFGPKVGYGLWLSLQTGSGDVEVINTLITGNSTGMYSYGNILQTFEDNVFVDNSTQMWLREPTEIQQIGPSNTFTRTNPTNSNTVKFGYQGVPFNQQNDLVLPTIGTNTDYYILSAPWTIGGAGDPTLTVPAGASLQPVAGFNVGGALGTGNLVVGSGVDFYFQSTGAYSKWQIDGDSVLDSLSFERPPIEVVAQEDIDLVDWSILSNAVAPLVVRRNGYHVTVDQWNIAGNTNTGGLFVTGAGSLTVRDSVVTGTKGYGIYSDSADVTFEGSNSVTNVTGTSSFAAFMTPPSLVDLPVGAFAGVYCVGTCTGVSWTGVAFSGNTVSGGNHN